MRLPAHRAWLLVFLLSGCAARHIVVADERYLEKGGRYCAGAYDRALAWHFAPASDRDRLTPDELERTRTRLSECLKRHTQTVLAMVDESPRYLGQEMSAAISAYDGATVRELLPRLETAAARRSAQEVAPLLAQRKPWEAWRAARQIAQELGSRIQAGQVFLASPHWAATEAARARGEPPPEHFDTPAETARPVNSPFFDQLASMESQLISAATGAAARAESRYERFFYLWLAWQYGAETLPAMAAAIAPAPKIVIGFEVPPHLKDCAFLTAEPPGPPPTALVQVSGCELLTHQDYVDKMVPWYEKGFTERWVSKKTQLCHRTQSTAPGEKQTRTTWEYGEQVTRTWTPGPESHEECVEVDEGYPVKDETQTLHEEKVLATRVAVQLKVKGSVLLPGTETSLGAAEFTGGRIGYSYQGEHARRTDVPDPKWLQSDAHKALVEQATVRVPAEKSTPLGSLVSRARTMRGYGDPVTELAEKTGLPIEVVKAMAVFDPATPPPRVVPPLEPEQIPERPRLGKSADESQ